MEKSLVKKFMDEYAMNIEQVHNLEKIIAENTQLSDTDAIRKDMYKLNRHYFKLITELENKNKQILTIICEA